MSKEKSPQSQSISGNSISGSPIQMGQARDGNVSQTQQVSQSGLEEAQKQLTTTEVIELLDRIEELLQGSDLPAEQKGTAKKYLNRVKEDVQEEEPDKELAGKSLKKVVDTIKTAGETVDTWQKIQPILGQLLGWFGLAKSFLGMP